jgi:hypothetical protein
MKRRLATFAAIGPGNRRKVEFLLHNAQYKPGEMPLTNKIRHPHWQQQRFIDLPRPECLAHARHGI